MRKLLVFFLLTHPIFLWKTTFPAKARPQSRSEVKFESLGSRGNRIEVDVMNPGLTKAECSALVAKYLEQARPAGQVSVHKPAPKLRNSLSIDAGAKDKNARF